MYFVMELCSGGHLGNLISRQELKRLDEDWAKRLIRQLISATAHMHSRGIAHRDIKLQNVLMDINNDDYNSQVKLIDLGYGAKFTNALPMRTKCGTPYTTSPVSFDLYFVLIFGLFFFFGLFFSCLLLNSMKFDV